MKKLILLFVFMLGGILLYTQDENLPKKIGFDPKRDPAKDLQTAIKKAQKQHKRILLDIGGEWCIWCRRLDAFIKADKQISKTMNANYVVVKVNFSKENKNESFLSNYPKIEGYPHIFVLESDGAFLHSQDTGLLEKEKSYDKDKILAFLKEWKKPKN